MLNPTKLKQGKEEFQFKMLNNNLIRPSNSEWASPESPIKMDLKDLEVIIDILIKELDPTGTLYIE